MLYRPICLAKIKVTKILFNFFRMNEQDLHLAKAMVRMDLQESPKVPRKTVVSKVQEKLQNFRLVHLSRCNTFRITYDVSSICE